MVLGETLVHRSKWTLIGLFGLAACGGTSVRRSDGDGTGGSSAGGSGGSTGARAGEGSSSLGAGTGGSGGVGGGNSGTGGRGGGVGGGSGGRGGGVGGGNSGTGGRGGGVGGGSGGGVSQGGATSTGGGGNIPGAGFGADGGAAGAPDSPDCEPLLSVDSCSFEETCEILECGAPWAAVDARMCARTECRWSGECASGERCLAAPITGRLDEPCFPEMDSCYATTSGCTCWPNVECGPSVRCVPIEEFPPERDCPLEGRDCAGLERAAATLAAYFTDRFFGFSYDAPPGVRSSLEACADAIAARRAADCP